MFSFISCSKVKEINLNLEMLDSGSTFRLDTINKADWDSLYIVKPYGKINPNKYSMPESVLKKINSTISSDNYCSLLFIKNNQVINYSIVPRNPIDFSMWEMEEINTFPSDQEYIVDNTRILLKSNK